MGTMTPLEQEVAELIIKSLNLEDITLSAIDPDAALFNEGLGLDSIDALELSMRYRLNMDYKCAPMIRITVKFIHPCAP